MRRFAIIAGASAILGHNAARFALDALVLRGARRRYPELFDGAAAAASIAAAIEEQLAA